MQFNFNKFYLRDANLFIKGGGWDNGVDIEFDSVKDAIMYRMANPEVNHLSIFKLGSDDTGDYLEMVSSTDLGSMETLKSAFNLIK